MSKKARINKYIKIKIQTQDDNLKRLLKSRIENRDFIHSELTNYCETQIGIRIPTWQVAAKKAGWQLPEQMSAILNLGK